MSDPVRFHVDRGRGDGAMDWPVLDSQMIDFNSRWIKVTLFPYSIFQFSLKFNITCLLYLKQLIRKRNHPLCCLRINWNKPWLHHHTRLYAFVIMPLFLLPCIIWHIWQNARYPARICISQCVWLNIFLNMRFSVECLGYSLALKEPLIINHSWQDNERHAMDE